MGVRQAPDNPEHLDEAVKAGQAVYTPFMLSVYDLVVLGFSNRLIWRCPTHHLIELYDENVGTKHLDVGVGTGFFLDKCRFDTPTPEITLLDLNQNALRNAAQRISRYNSVRCHANVLEPLDLGAIQFESVGLNYLFHCLPGPISVKADTVFSNLAPFLAPGAHIFGSTIVAEGVTHNRVAQRLLASYNRRSIFSNQTDTVSDLESVLARSFHKHKVMTRGSVAIFTATTATSRQVAYEATPSLPDA